MKTSSVKMKKFRRQLPSVDLIMGPPPEVHPDRDIPEVFAKDGSCEKVPLTPNLSLNERWDIFMNETSFTALTRIHKASTVIKKIIWIVILLAMLSWLSLQCFWLFEKYFEYPVEVKIDMISLPKMEFPSVTICNRNPLKKSKVKGSPFENIENHFVIERDESMYDKALERFKQTEGWEDYYGMFTSVIKSCYNYLKCEK